MDSAPISAESRVLTTSYDEIRAQYSRFTWKFPSHLSVVYKKRGLLISSNDLAFVGGGYGL